MQRLYGSDDLFPDGLQETCRPHQSVNFITAHDGFCLYDLVSYDRKHNQANGHGNTDGTDDNLRWNCGVEGDEHVPDAVRTLRRRQAKNFCALLMLANGLPMIVAGDEFLNTQHGNNNPYNQDNEITWLDWARLVEHRDVFRFFKLMIAFRKAHSCIGQPTFWREAVSWHGPNGPVDLGHESRCLAYFLSSASTGGGDLYVMINGHWEDHRFTVAEGQASEWRRVVDTAQPSPTTSANPDASRVWKPRITRCRRARWSCFSAGRTVAASTSKLMSQAGPMTNTERLYRTRPRWSGRSAWPIPRDTARSSCGPSRTGSATSRPSPSATTGRSRRSACRPTSRSSTSSLA